MKRQYVMNPGYMLVPDGTRVLFVSQDNVDPGVIIGLVTFIHLMHNYLHFLMGRIH